MKNKFEIRGDKVAVFLTRRDKSILETIIDKDDLGRTQELNGTWCADWEKLTQSFYVKSMHTDANGKRVRVKLHRWIMKTPDDLKVDHINHDTLDNARSNLRNVTSSVNSQNRRLHKGNTSGFRGVHWGDGKWQASIWTNGKALRLGSFDDAAQAGEVAHQARIKYMAGYVHEKLT